MSGRAFTPGPVVYPVETDEGWRPERRMMLLFLIAGFCALLIGASIGPLQALNYDGVNAYPALRSIFHTYYQGLTVHGVLNGYVFTFFVTCGLLVYLPARELGQRPSMALWGACFGLMAVGALSLIYAMFDNSSSVLWTFYPPLKGSPFFYLGMTILTLGSVQPLPILLKMRAAWKRAHPGCVTPLVTYMSLVTMLMWTLAGVGALSELILQLDPWSLGLIGTIDPLINRTLFWLTGHPIVYFWLMPAYISWYGLLSRQAGGKLASDPMARMTFALLLIFSLPVGSHHQFSDPGFSQIWRAILVVLTMSVAIPSIITAFTLGLSLEYAGRMRGGLGLVGWFRALPWSDPSVAAQVLGALTFILGGATGIVNGSWELDAIVHNTTFVPGHFHVTVGSVTAMTFMGLAFWMIPHLTGRKLISRRIALFSVWTWFVGMTIFAIGMQWAGLYGVPRRAWVSALPHETYHALYGVAATPTALIAVGGVILWVATYSFFLVFFGTLLFGRRAERPAVPFAQALSGPVSHETGVAIPVATGHGASVLANRLEHVWALVGLTAVATVAAYVPILWPFLHNVTHSPGWVLW
ncbi:cytochrome c oxidase subunit I [Acetobacter nitrogenifigens DSM 23921 = NBRC 105050]|uniref:Cytochrome c oxidase subunit 1 n=1 Tax=Acetobacter nitrogenifigens DSM 23921 = NBRC 105050 TaxID=1120919 RepID=A0A511X9J1_9PROT|nr:cbb3-type cytochrome c oxidase subunit I [Acetobacter nitrogenifigens]GBQ93559.1 cytochrome c oxidase subunit I [Acetobacter nitrogenifigens DSM 23921 = NBRC 105050]GEN59605.1 cytochrome c oxidase subunit 1 [Acetobacter nitrogenifigens DSM 23921 = NBRC 105050]